MAWLSRPDQGYQPQPPESTAPTYVTPGTDSSPDALPGSPVLDAGRLNQPRRAGIPRPGRPGRHRQPLRIARAPLVASTTTSLQGAGDRKPSPNSAVSRSPSGRLRRNDLPVTEGSPHVEGPGSRLRRAGPWPPPWPQRSAFVSATSSDTAWGLVAPVAGLQPSVVTWSPPAAFCLPPAPPPQEAGRGTRRRSYPRSQVARLCTSAIRPSSRRWRAMSGPGDGVGSCRWDGCFDPLVPRGQRSSRWVPGREGESTRYRAWSGDVPLSRTAGGHPRYDSPPMRSPHSSSASAGPRAARPGTVTSFRRAARRASRSAGRGRGRVSSVISWDSLLAG